MKLFNYNAEMLCTYHEIKMQWKTCMWEHHGIKAISHMHPHSCCVSQELTLIEANIGWSTKVGWDNICQKCSQAFSYSDYTAQVKIERGGPFLHTKSHTEHHTHKRPRIVAIQVYILHKPGVYQQIWVFTSEHVLLFSHNLTHHFGKFEHTFIYSLFGVFILVNLLFYIVIFE